MKILFAAPDRDLLECYKSILENDMGELIAAFDGAQVLSLVGSEKFDISVLDCDLPRVEFDRLTAKMKEMQIPVIALTNGHKAKDPKADAYLTYPFTPDVIEDLIRKTLDRAKKGQINE